MDISVGELVRMLARFSPNAKVIFGGDPRGLEFYRVKHRGRSTKTGEEVVQIEFNQLVYRDRKGELVVEEP